MYKKQLAIQKKVCLLCVIAAAICFVYSLGVITDIYDALYTTMTNPKDLTKTTVPGSIIYYDMQGFNKSFLYASIGLILAGCLLFITNTNSRRRYYIGNYFATGVYAVGALAVGFWMHAQINAFKVQFLTTVDFEALRKHADLWKGYYTESTFWFDLHYAVLVILVIAALALVLNMVWKIKLMRDEASLLAQAKEVAV